MNNPTWKIVLNHFEKERYIANGLTIPYLIGARQFFKSLNRTTSVKEFIEELINSNVKTTIMKCVNINEYIIGLLDSETEKLINEKYPNLYPRFGNLHLQGLSEELSMGKTGLMSALEMEYQSKVDNGHYSVVNGTWSQFSSSEILKIKEAIKNYHQHGV